MQCRKYSVPGFDNAYSFASSSLSVVKALELQHRLFSRSLTRAGDIGSRQAVRRCDAYTHTRWSETSGVLAFAIGPREMYTAFKALHRSRRSEYAARLTEKRKVRRRRGKRRAARRVLIERRRAQGQL